MMKLSMQLVLGWVFKARYLCMFEAIWIPVALPFSYSCSILRQVVEARVESVQWQEDDRVALVEKAYYYSLTKKR